MKVYFINLDRSPERLEWYLRQAAKYGLEAVRISAVDARHLNESDIDRFRSLSSGQNSLSPGEIGCFLSHRKIWQAVVDGEEDWAFASEDDLHLAEDAANFVNDATWIPPGVDLIKAETNLRQRVELSYEVIGRPFQHELRHLRSFHYGSGGYFVSRKAAANLLAFTEHHCEPSDVVLFSPPLGVLKQLAVLQLIPAICLQDIFVAAEPDASELASIIQQERTIIRRSDPNRAKGKAKLRREIKRTARQVANYFRRFWLRGTRKAVFHVVPAQLTVGKNAGHSVGT